MNTVSLELCKKIYFFTGWCDGVQFVYYSNDGVVNAENVWPQKAVFDKPGNIPAYDLGYLLRKLPAFTDVSVNEKLYSAKHISGGLSKVAFESAETPEDAVAKLVIRLFEKGVLKHE